jgi:hypothetical protein
MSQGDGGPVRSGQDRRKGDRRRRPRSGSDRRCADRRQSGASAAGFVLMALALASAPTARAQVYTRKNANGVVEATNVPASRDYRLTYPGKGTVIHSRAYRLRPSYNGEYNHHIAAAAALHGVDTEFVRAIIQVESDFDHLARSSKGAQGLMQLMPDTARRFGVTNAYDPRQNIFGGVRYLRWLLDMFRGDVSLAAAGYNAGENAVLRYGGVPPYKETRGYVDKVQTLLGGGGLYTPLPTAAQATAAFFTPDPGAFSRPAVAPASLRGAAAAPARKGKLQPARPRVYYKWTDTQGVLHVTQTAPAEGVVYTMIRALD